MKRMAIVLFGLGLVTVAAGCMGGGRGYGYGQAYNYGPSYGMYSSPAPIASTFNSCGCQ